MGSPNPIIGSAAATNSFPTKRFKACHRSSKRRSISSSKPRSSLQLSRARSQRGCWSRWPALDRNRARPAVGEGFPFLLFRLQDEFAQSPRWLTFPRSPPIIPDSQISRGVRFETLAFFRRPSQASRFKRWSYTTPAPLVCLQPRLLTRSLALRRFYQAGRHTAEDAAAKCPEPPALAQLRCYLRLGDVSAISSSEGVTPPSSLLRGSWCHSRWALSCFWHLSLVRIVLGRSRRVPGAAHGSFPTSSRTIFPWMLDPVPLRFSLLCFHRVLLR